MNPINPMTHMRRCARRAAAMLCAMVTAIAFLPVQAWAVGDTSTDSRTGSGVILAQDNAGGGEAGGSLAGPVPNIIITNFTYDGDSVAAGAKFNLAFTFQNKGRVAVSNMVVTVDGGESFVISGGTNTFYVDALWAGYSMTQTVPMQAVSSATSGAQPVTVSFAYEYVDAGARSSHQSDIKISVPISQPDRFEINDPVLPDESAGGAYAGQETTITLEYVNKGKGDISNVEATMEGEGFDATQKTQYVGNVTSGATGSIGYAFTPQAPGEFNATLKVSYEDSDGQTKTKDFPISMTVADAPAADPGQIDDMNVESTQQGPAWWVWLIAAVVAVGAIAGIVIAVRRRKRRKVQSQDDDDWDDWVNAGSTGGTVDEVSVANQDIAEGDAPAGADVASIEPIPADPAHRA